MNKIPSLSQGLHAVSQETRQDIPSGLSDKDQIRYEYGRERDMSKVTYYPARKDVTLFDPRQRSRVVVYCRVSTDGISQTSSFELQKHYYLKYVRKHGNWKLVAMFSDEGITATSTEKRIGLLQMLEDAKAGLFDIIIVKNLSRLSRNLMDCMNIIYALRALPHPVGIFFETENLFTLDKSADFTLQVLSLVAQEESHKKSEAMLGSYFMRFSQGQYMVPDLLGYDKAGKNKISINVEEAKTVQLIFMMYLAGYSCKVIANVLTMLGRKTHTRVKKNGEVIEGEVKWTAASVLSILQNERRCGDVLAQKTYTPNYLDHKSKKNIDALPKFYAQDEHPAIVAPADYLLTQRMIAANRGGWTGNPPEMSIYTKGGLSGFVTAAPNWRGFSAEDYNRACLRAYGVSEEELTALGGSFDQEEVRTPDIGEGEPASESGMFEHRYAIDSDDYTLYPDTGDEQVIEDEEIEISTFAKMINEFREKHAPVIQKGLYSGYDLSECELIRCQMFSLYDKPYFTMDKGAMTFNKRCLDALGGSTLDEIEVAYNPMERILLVHRAPKPSLRSLHWVGEKNGKAEMRRCPCHGLTEAIYQNMKWNRDYKLRIVGSVIEIDGETVLSFELDEPIMIVPTEVRKKKAQTEKRHERRETKVLIEAGYITDDIRIPTLAEYDFGSQALNDEIHEYARSRAIYYDEFTSAEGSIHVADLKEKKFDPECIRQILMKGRCPEEGWLYLKGMAVLGKRSFTIFPDGWSESFGPEVYKSQCVKELNRQTGTFSATPYGWTTGLVLPTVEIVERTIRELASEQVGA